MVDRGHIAVNACEQLGRGTRRARAGLRYPEYRVSPGGRGLVSRMPGRLGGQKGQHPGQSADQLPAGLSGRGGAKKPSRRRSFCRGVTVPKSVKWLRNFSQSPILLGS